MDRRLLGTRVTSRTRRPGFGDVNGGVGGIRVGIQEKSDEHLLHLRLRPTLDCALEQNLAALQHASADDDMARVASVRRGPPHDYVNRSAGPDWARP